MAVNYLIFAKEKVTADGVFEKMKIRGVANEKGKNNYGDGYKNVNSSPVVSIVILFLLLVIALHQNLKLATIDYPGAYLKSRLKKKVLIQIKGYMVSILLKLQPSLSSGYDPTTKTLYARVIKSLYGLAESGKNWYDLVVTKLESLGFHQNPLEKCLFARDKEIRR